MNGTKQNEPKSILTRMKMFYRRQTTPFIRLSCLHRIAHNCGQLRFERRTGRPRCTRRPRRTHRSIRTHKPIRTCNPTHTRKPTCTHRPTCTRRSRRTSIHSRGTNIPPAKSRTAFQSSTSTSEKSGTSFVTGRLYTPSDVLIATM